MKSNIKHLGLIILLSVYSSVFAATYTWTGSTSTDYQVATNWTPERATAAGTDDIVITPLLDGTVAITNVPSQTINSLTINGAGTVNMSGGTNTLTFSSGGSINIEAGNILDMGTVRMALSNYGTSGTLTTSGTGSIITAATSSALPVTTTANKSVPNYVTFTFDVTYNGSATQTIGYGIYTNFTLNSSVAFGTVAANIAGGDATINGTLTLTKGILACGTGSGRNLTIATTATIAGGSNQSYVYTANGTIYRKGVGTSTFLYPLGTLSSYAPLTITNSANNPNIIVKLKPAITYVIANPTNAVNLEWSVISSIATTADIIYQFNTADFATAYSVGSSSELGNYKTAYTVTSVGTATGSNPYTVSTTALSIPTSGSNLYVIGNLNAIIGGTTSVSDINKKSFNVEVISTATQFLVNYSIPTASSVKVRLLNLNGQTLQNFTSEKQQIGQTQISSVFLVKGLYLVEVQADEKKVTKKVVKY